MPSKLLKSYHNRKAACGDTFVCRGCEQSLSAIAFENHAKDCLGLNPRTHCVWCLGESSWPSMSKGLYKNHLLNCLEACLFRQRAAAPLPSPVETPIWEVVYHSITKPTPQPSVVRLGLDDDQFMDSVTVAPSHESLFILDTEPLCPERDLFGYPRLSELLPDLAYELFNVLDLPVPALPYQDEHLNLAIGCMQAFFERRDTHDFVHCMVRALAFPKFIAVMMHSSYGRKIRMLPFSCWCNGGRQYAHARHRQHRHMILVVPKNISKTQWQKHVWGKLHCREDSPVPGFRGHLKRTITEPMHLANALGYLSDRKSRCNGLEQDKAPLKRNHFWILTSLPAHFRLPLAMQWDGGILQLVHQLYRYMKPDALVALPRCRENGQWKIQVKELPGLPRRLVMPVAKTFRPSGSDPSSSSSSSSYLHLAGGQKVYFEEDAASLAELDDVAWGRVQADAGNVFYDRIGDMKWTPSKFQQKCLNAIDVYRVQFEAMRQQLEDTLESERARMQATLDLERSRMKQAIDAEVKRLREEEVVARRDE